MMSPDDLAVMIAFAFVGYGLYVGLRRIAEALDTFSARLVSRTITVTLPEIHVYHEGAVNGQD